MKNMEEKVKEIEKDIEQINKDRDKFYTDMLHQSFFIETSKDIEIEKYKNEYTDWLEQRVIDLYRKVIGLEIKEKMSNATKGYNFEQEKK